MTQQEFSSEHFVHLMASTRKLLIEKFPEHKDEIQAMEFTIGGNKVLYVTPKQASADLYSKILSLLPQYTVRQ